MKDMIEWFKEDWLDCLTFLCAMFLGIVVTLTITFLPLLFVLAFSVWYLLCLIISIPIGIVMFYKIFNGYD